MTCRYPPFWTKLRSPLLASAAGVTPVLITLALAACSPASVGFRPDSQAYHDLDGGGGV
jgi:hypothetical protein